MKDIDATWVPVDLHPTEWVGNLPVVSRNHSVKIGLVARARVKALERGGGKYDAAFFNHILPALFLRRFRMRVPSVDSLDVTPMGLLKHGQAYYDRPRAENAQAVQMFKQIMARRSYDSARHLFPWSEFTRQSLLADYGIDAAKMTVLSPGVDLSRFSCQRTISEKGGDDRYRVLFVGGDFLRKGGDLLLELAKQDEFRDWEFHFVTRAFVGEHGSNVHVYSDISANETRLLDLYNRADIFALPTRADFAPTNSISEAMAMSLPIISTDVGGLSEVVIPEETGLLVDIDDLGSLARCLKSLAENPDMRARLGRNARKLAERRFDVTRNSSIVIERMKELADSKEKGPLPGVSLPSSPHRQLFC